MLIDELLAVIFYCLILFGIGFFSLKKQMSSQDFLIGGRSMNFWLTALAAHASDMSSWLLMGFPAAVYIQGVFGAWAAVGLAVFMFLNWQLVAPRIRSMTEKYSSLTFSSFYESRFNDTSGLIRVFTAIMSLGFFTVYISAGLVALGMIMGNLFGISYDVAITVGLLVVIPYLFFGGYRTLAWIDMFQGTFLLVVIVFVPLVALGQVGGLSGVWASLRDADISTSFFPGSGGERYLDIFLTAGGWGLGYFGQPHIVTKFMGIKHVNLINKAKIVGMSWQIIALTSATFIGLIGVAYFQNVGLANPEFVFIFMVRDLFPPLLSAFILCAGLAATISTMDSQILVLATSLTEDFYKRMFRKNASSRELLWITRFFIVLAALLAYGIAWVQQASIFGLVMYAWSGLGAAFGPLLLFCLYSKKANKYGAWAGILVGGSVSALWGLFGPDIQPLIPAFSLSALSIWLFSHIQPKTHTLHDVEHEVSS